MPRYQGLPPIGQGRLHGCQTWMPPRIRLHLSHILARIILSYRHSIGCSRAKDRQSARAAMLNIVWASHGKSPMCRVCFLCSFLCVCRCVSWFSLFYLGRFTVVSEGVMQETRSRVFRLTLFSWLSALDVFIKTF